MDEIISSAILAVLSWYGLIKFIFAVINEDEKRKRENDCDFTPWRR